MNERSASEPVSPPEPAPERHPCEAGLVRAFDFLGKRWNGVILGSLSDGPVGFAELRRVVGAISDSVLSDRLTELAEGGLVERTVTDTRPPGVTYGLTAAGTALLPILNQLAAWADVNLHLPVSVDR
jgi:DNA-binding HxlR family transcriptional regulator